MVELYVKKGIERQDAERMTDILANYESAWVDVMMVEELGILEASESRVKERACHSLLIRYLRVRAAIGVRCG